MKLQDILGSIEYLEVHADGDLQIGGITADSRRVQKDDLFVAISGFTSDGNRFIPMAMDKGAAVVVTAKKPETDVPYVLVPSDRKALAQCAAALYGHPSKAMTMIGITGTNGKTSVTLLLKHVLEKTLGAKVVCVLIGERPGLATAESMSAYIAYNAYVGMPESKRTVVSNIHRNGTAAVEAGAYIAEVIAKILEQKASGVDLVK